MAANLKIEGNFLVITDTIDGEDYLRLPRSNVRYLLDIDGADTYFEFLTVGIVQGVIFPKGKPKFLFADILDDRTGAAFTNVAELNTFLSINTGQQLSPVQVLKYTGWEYYKDSQYTSVSPLTINNSNTLVTIDGAGATTDTSQSPADAVNPLWDTTNNKITPINTGDAYAIRLGFTGKSNKDTYFTVKLDIGTSGSPIIISGETKISPKTNLVPTTYSFDIPVFCLNTFITNGGKMYIDNTDDASSMDVYDLELTIVRTHKAV